jgi:glutamyl-tRNA synthetase
MGRCDAEVRHLPLLLKPDGTGKLSKRDGDRLGFPVFPLDWEDPKTGEKSSGYKQAGYLPEAVVNLLAFFRMESWHAPRIVTLRRIGVSILTRESRKTWCKI